MRREKETERVVKKEKARRVSTRVGERGKERDGASERKMESKQDKRGVKKGEKWRLGRITREEKQERESKARKHHPSTAHERIPKRSTTFELHDDASSLLLGHFGSGVENGSDGFVAVL